MNNLEEIKQLIESKLTGSIVKVNDLTGTQDHLDIMVVSDEFKNKMLIEQHQIVMNILKESLREKIHAVKIKTLTVEKYKHINGG